MTRILFMASGVLAISFAALTAEAALADVKAGVDAWSSGDYAAAIRQWQPLAEQGDSDALFNLAQAYKLGRGVPVDIAKAEVLYGKAAARGHTQAADAYGLLLFQRGERPRALPFVEASAARGDPRAQYILSVAYFNGDIVQKDWVRAYALASLARQADLPQAISVLAQMDQQISLADRQKSVLMAEQLAAQARANRERLNTSQELGTSLVSAEPQAPPLMPARNAVAQAAPVVSLASPATPGAGHVRPREAQATMQPREPLTRQAGGQQPKPIVASAVPGSRPTSQPTAPASGPWRIQLGAFAVKGNAEALWNRVKGRPEIAGHSRALNPAGRLTKLQATGFASRSQADAACKRLSASGVACLPSRD